MWFWMQPEGNLFRDRFVSMQHRALIEPHAFVRYVLTPPPHLCPAGCFG